MPSPAYRHIVALGSSFASGPGIPPYADKTAGRSQRNYPSVLADLLGSELTDRSCSGATTAHIVHQRQRIGLTTRSPQLEYFPADADLVTFTAGGNDLSYIGSMIKLGCAGRLPNPLMRPIARLLELGGPPALTESDITDIAEAIARIVDTVRHRAPAARIVLVEYLTVLGPDTKPNTPAVPFTEAQLSGFRYVANNLVHVFAKAASLSGADVVPMSVISAEHALGSEDPWVVGMPDKITNLLRHLPFHPNAAGMEATARAIAHHVRRP
ncbi:SGNH/GDSL hydrolase family protein [Hoyosella altamirensis]|uniref:SGNH/GDSL hydrolase family protein n=1 Tax=Hoyosella altamirensis TaxID=616997 RepID=UPI000942C56D|nr:SGNH/GDSL hydrolase family protein [Hoyosella altamirensis]